MPTVLITGAAGRVGRYLRSGVSAATAGGSEGPEGVAGRPGPRGVSSRTDLPSLGWDLRLLDREPIEGEPDAIVADIRDRAALAKAMAGVDAVVHLAGAVRPSDSFAEVLAGNIEGTYEVLTAARKASVERVVFASSNHANGFAPRVGAGDAAVRPPVVGDRPDSYYGVSKLFGEALARLFVDRYGMRIACIRIGSCFDKPTDPRMLATWLSPGDLTRLVHACLTAPDLDYAVIYGASHNARRWWDLSPSQALGYEPQDDAEVYASEILAPYGGVDPGRPDDPQGGSAAWRAGDLDRG
jgi:uronate dehydrogenase